MVFDEQFFFDHQAALVTLANSPIGKFSFGLDINDKRPIDFILPSSLGWIDKNKQITQQFHSGIPHAKTLYKRLYPLWRSMHEFDRIFAQNLAPVFDLGFSTLTANPVSGATSPCDGPVNEVGQNSTFATIRGAAGNQGGLETVTGDNASALVASTTSNQYAELHRSIYNFTTSSLTSAASISALTFGLYFDNQNNALGSPDLHICGATPASTAAIVAADFAQIASTSYGNVTYAGVTLSTLNTITLNSSGISNVNKTGVSSFGTRLSWDINNSTTGLTWASGGQSYFHALYADNGSNKPTLTVTYSLGSLVNQIVQVLQSIKRSNSY